MSMAARKEMTKKYGREYASAANKDMGRMLDELVAVTDWSRANARRAIAPAAKRRGPARAVQRKPRGAHVRVDTLKVLIQVWTLIGVPCGKYLVPIMAPILAQLEAFGELGKVADRLSTPVREQLVTMSAATIETDAQTHQGRRLPRGEVRDPSRGHAAFVDRGAQGDG